MNGYCFSVLDEFGKVLDTKIVPDLSHQTTKPILVDIFKDCYETLEVLYTDNFKADMNLLSDIQPQVKILCGEGFNEAAWNKIGMSII